MCDGVWSAMWEMLTRPPYFGALECACNHLDTAHWKMHPRAAKKQDAGKKTQRIGGGLVYQAGMFRIFLCTPRAPFWARAGALSDRHPRVVRVPANWLMTVDSRKRISTGPSTVEEVMTSLHLK